MGSSVSGVGVIDKAAAVLAALEAAPRSLGELVADTGFSRATAHRLAVALEAHGLVRRDEDGRFALGVRLIALGRAAAEAIPLAEAALPALAALRDETAESVQLYVRDGDRRMRVVQLHGPLLVEIRRRSAQRRVNAQHVLQRTAREKVLLL